ncbi:MAG TPA: endonuclease [Candidatus Edwardsbacteria bacterium]|nr:endonuclease [Candidatus Edwardsbacteria bacterium]
MKKIVSFAIALGLASTLHAGTVPPDSTIFPGMMGRPLIDSLRAHFKTSTCLSYNTARDKIYGEIDITADSLTCVYCGWTIHGGPTAAPRTWTNNNDINCEHTWPQSLLASQTPDPTCDMNHMYGTEMQVNGDRGNLPFGEIPDAQVNKWYRNDTIWTSQPSANLDQYARLMTNVKFQPRAVQKGNTARALYYMLTMYQLQDTTLPWWTGQKDDMYAWHVADPADAREIARTHAIAAYQSNKPNPFILDSTLIRRAYFPTMGVAGAPAANAALAALSQNSPNPFRGSTTIRYSLAQPSTVQLSVYNILGQAVYQSRPVAVSAGSHDITWDGRSMPQGVYFYRLSVDNVTMATRRMLLVK